ncbi:MAG: TatD family hydrolase [Saccharofermentanales bacterium]|jgi:TatD DNase family protein
MWFDTHAHLQDNDFKEDLPDVLARARAQGVERIMLAASTEGDSNDACRLALKHPMLYAAVGIHPHEASSWDIQMGDRLHWLVEKTNKKATERSRDPVVVAWGEIGLDFHYDHSPRDVQAKVFRKQLEWAHRLDLPVIIHMRDATARALEILEKAYDDGLFSTEHPAGVVHCYSGSPETLRPLLSWGFMIGFDGPITFAKSKQPKASLAAVPLDRLVLETDAPWLTPTPYRGKRNESSYLPFIGEAAAEIKAMPVEDIARITTKNALRLFRIDA